MDYAVIVTFLIGLAPWVKLVIEILGALLVIGTAVDKMTPDAGAFMSKVFNIPILGGFLDYLTRFSPFNYKE